MSKRDYYEILEIPRQASAEEVKKAFRKKARHYHPDVNQDPAAEGLFKELGEAYEVLSDSQKRQVYDAYGHEGLGSGAGYQPSWDFMQAFPDLNDLFAQFFGGGFTSGSTQHRMGPSQGEDLRYDLELDFMDAVFGCQQQINVNQLVFCAHCHGTGASPDSGGPATCQTCMGQGQIRPTAQTILGHFTQITTCPRCAGRGTMVVDPCTVCHAKGRKPHEKPLTLTIPAGVDTGTRLRVSAEGNSGTLGGPPGDLYVFLHARSHELFRREGYNLYASIPVSYTQLVLGCTIEVPALKGKEVLKIPPGTESGAVFTLRHKGVPMLNTHGQHGDYYIQVVVDIPKKLSPEERKLLEKLKALETGRRDGAVREKTLETAHTPHAFVQRLREAFS
jgi:molecular chaperone DnaJ